MRLVDEVLRGVAHGVEVVAERAGGGQLHAEIFQPAAQSHGFFQQQARALILATAIASSQHQEEEDRVSRQPGAAGSQGRTGRSSRAGRRRQAGKVEQVGSALVEESAVGLAQEFLAQAMSIKISLDLGQDGGFKLGQSVDFAQKGVQVGIHR